MGTTTRDGYDDLPGFSEDGYPAAVCACGAECAYPTDRICDDCWRAARTGAADLKATAELPAMTMAELVFGGGR